MRDVFDADSMSLLRAASASRIAAIPPPAAGQRRGAAVLREFALRHRARAQRQPDQHRRALRREVFEQDRRNVNTESDSEVLLNVFAHGGPAEGADPEAAFPRDRGRQPPRQGRLRGGLQRAGPGPGRVPRPARHPPAGALGKPRDANGGDEYMVASESVALDVSASSACATWSRARAW